MLVNLYPHNNRSRREDYLDRICLTVSLAIKMRGKRSKQYRKLMAQFEMTFGFRGPYQVLSPFASPVP